LRITPADAIGNIDLSHRWNLFLGGSKYSAWLWEVAMPLTGSIPEGHSFFCPRCGALYAVTYSRQWKSVDIDDDVNGAECVVCGQTMATWSSTDVPTYKLVHRPEDA
jgi:uncharacterized protein (DUF983 family)